MHARIVIVDDRSTNLRVYAQYVAMMGPEFSAKCFHSAVNALECADNNRRQCWYPKPGPSWHLAHSEAPTKTGCRSGCAQALVGPVKSQAARQTATAAPHWPTA